LSEILRVSEKTARRLLKPRGSDAHKGDNGAVAVVGGSRIYHGAPFLAASAALRSGVDLTYLCVPPLLLTAVRALSPNLIVIPRPDVKLTVGAVNKLMKWLPDVDAAVIGPGLGRQKPDGAVRLVSELASKGAKLVLDADALRTPIVDAAKGREAVITPHGGEFKRLFDIDLGASVESRSERVREMAERSGLTVLLKGQIDVISDGERVAVNHTGSPAMTAGGTGDVLSGVVAGLMAKRLEPFDAACLGAYFNGLAGEMAAGRLGMHIVATDLIDDLPKVMMPFD
jgi:ADP-dependent NAD(P)H-hydrate dehydratase